MVVDSKAVRRTVAVVGTVTQAREAQLRKAQLPMELVPRLSRTSTTVYGSALSAAGPVACGGA